MAESALRQYEYGGEGLFGFLMPERREILSPEQQLLQGYESTRRGPAAVIETIPARYGEPEVSFEYTPVVRGIRSALNAVQDLFTSPPTVEQAKEAGTSALRGIDQYMRDQATAGALGGTAYNPETGQVTDFDPTVAMVGGAPAGVQAVRAATPGSVVLGMIGSKNAKFTPEQLASIRQIDEAGFDTDQLFLHGTSDEIDQLSIGKTQKRDSGFVGTGAYSTPEPRISSGYANLATPTTRDNMGDWAGPNTFPLITRKGNYKQYTLKEKSDLAQKARANPEFSQQLAEQNIAEGYIGADVVDADGSIIERVNYFPDTDTRSAFDYSVPETTLRSGSKRGTGVAGLSALNDLDMSYDARMRRADEMGMTTQGYSGSTHDISRFRGDISNPENDWGRGTYASTSIDDVNANYAGVGPDLTSRIEVRAEQIKDDAAFNDDDLKSAFESQSGKPWDNMNYDEKLDIARGLAEKELIGDAQGGIVYPLRINTEKYAVIGGPNSTVLKFDKSALKGLDPDSDEYYEAITEASDDLYQSVYDALSSTDAYIEDGDIMKVMSEVSDSLAGGDLDLTDLDSAIRRHIIDAYDDDTGGMVSPGGISAQVLKNLGYEGVIDNTVNTKFGTGRRYGQSMAGVNPDTQHIITFPDYESRIRSTYAAFDPSKKSSSDILAGITGGSLIGGSALSGQRQENNN